MKKKAYIICDNHLDIIWRRGFERQFEYGGGIIRPYADIEEMLFDRWMEIIEKTGCVYSIEQSLSVKKYLERNPDKVGKFKDLIEKGKLRFYGGGETVIDSNLVTGESIVRNHMYSILWYEKNFHIRPEYASVRDAFGMSAQLPQIFRKLGYWVLFAFAYTGKPQKPYWKGLNGDLLYFLSNFDDIPGVALFYAGKGYMTPVCPSCAGSGCGHCDWSGFDYSQSEMPEYEKLDAEMRRFAGSPDQNLILLFTSEEIGERGDIVKETGKLAEKYGIEQGLSHNMALLEQFAGDSIKRLKEGNPSPADIDPRMDWNPACTGVYVTRIRLKQINRELENALLSCEKLAVFASGCGMVYPAKKLERLWGQMAVLQFHDGITSSHSDGAYRELIELCSNIAAQAARINREAMKTLEKNISVGYKEGYTPFIVFNPLAWEVKDTVVNALLNIENRADLDELTAGRAEVIDAAGSKAAVYDAFAVKKHLGHSVCVKFKCDRLPPLGYKTYYAKLDDCFENADCPPEITELRAHRNYHIENEFYRIDIKGHVITGIYDKKLNEFVLGEHAGAITIEDDIGSPWETLVLPAFETQMLYDPYTLEDMLPADYTVSASIRRSGGATVFAREGRYSNKPKSVESLIWRQEFMLYDGADNVRLKTKIDWNAERSRIRLAFPLAFKPENDAGYYEIPYGTVKREAYEPTTGGYTCKNGDWPALNFVACRNEEKDYTVAVINKGTPSYCVRDGVVLLSVLRSPREYFCAFNIEGAADAGGHIFEHCLVSGKGGLKDCDIVRKGNEFNTVFANCAADVKNAAFPDEYSFLSNKEAGVIISAVKQAENGCGIIVRAYEAYGRKVTDSVRIFEEDSSAAECGLLENKTTGEAGEFSYEPYEIKTLLFIQDHARA